MQSCLGVEFIKHIFNEGEDLYKTDIDQKVVLNQGYQTANGLIYLLREMVLAITRDGKMNGHCVQTIDKPQLVCESFTARLTQNSLAIFSWIEILEESLQGDNKRPLCDMMEHIKSFMHLFEIAIPARTEKGTLVTAFEMNFTVKHLTQRHFLM